MHKKTSVKLSANSSAETLQGRREWHSIFQVWKEKCFLPRIPYPAKLSFRNEGKIKFFRQVKDKGVHHWPYKKCYRDFVKLKRKSAD